MKGGEEEVWNRFLAALRFLHGGGGGGPGAPIF